MVIKDAKPSVHEWRDPFLRRDRKPREIRVHELVDNHREALSDSRRVLVRHYAHRLMMRRRRYRLYLEYYPGGDLENALGWDLDDELGQQRPNPVPEKFIWEVFTSLVRAVRVLQTGHDTPVSANAPVGWKPISHLDIGLRNVFIGYAPDEKPTASTSVEETGMVNLIVHIAIARGIIRLWTLLVRHEP